MASRLQTRTPVGRPANLPELSARPLVGWFSDYQFREILFACTKWGGAVFRNKKVVVVMPAYNAATTLRRTYGEVMAQGIVDLVVIVDDASQDDTASVARGLPNTLFRRHPVNRGYGANQKTCYRLALEAGADIVVMVHPDHQYTPRLIPAMVSSIANGLYSCVLGSRILGGGALRGGMPRWKYFANRALTFTENLLLGGQLSEYHTGYRAYARHLLERLPLGECDDGFVFDNQVLAQIHWLGEPIGEVTCPAHYGPESSSIGFAGSVIYGLGCLRTAVSYRLAKMGMVSPAFLHCRPDRIRSVAHWAPSEAAV
jgi:glycosyltransferase involved in cell wall biosynthesis